MIIAQLSILDWGCALGGRHFSGNLLYNKDKDYISIKVRHKLTQKEATELNKIDGNTTYEAGDESDRYNTKEQIIIDAFKLLVKEEGRGIMLNGYGYPDEILAWSKEVDSIVNELNKINKIFWKKGGFNHYKDKNNEATKLWHKWEEKFNTLKNL
jgi:hypothetical protein